MKTKYQILIIGGGTGGIMTAAQLLKKNPGLDIGVIEPADTHYYQPAWTLVGAGTYDYQKTAKPMAEVMPKGVDWIKDKVTALAPESNSLTTAQNGTITYEYLVVSPGLVMNLDGIEGLREALEKGVVNSVYLNPEETWKQLQAFKGGNAIFTQPSTPIKCGGAPQKIAYLAADYFRKNGISSKANVVYATPGSVIFGVREIRDTLTQVINRYGIVFKPYYSPFKIDPDNKVIYFKYTAADAGQCVITTDNKIGEKLEGETVIQVPFDFLHLAPPQAAPDFVKHSPLANEAGWMDVDLNSLQSKKYLNVFGIGDVAALPTAKTGAAIRKQVPVVVDNIMKMLRHEPADNKGYDGYSSCPLITGYGKMVLAEFNYKNEFTPDPKLKGMLIRDSSKEHWRLWILKKYILPYLYWNKMMKGEEV
jgi:sulfide:quinone oxidoreductase